MYKCNTNSIEQLFIILI